VVVYACQLSRLIVWSYFICGKSTLLKVEFFGATGCEFHVCLQKGSPTGDRLLPERRIKLLKEMLIDLREQTEPLVRSGNMPTLDRHFNPTFDTGRFAIPDP